ncbi:MAG: hypothetical protein ACFFBD_19815 [Candidatus Hodarchaeota archaeon]
MRKMSEESNDYPDIEETIEESAEFPEDLDKMPEFEYLLRTKTREFIFETIPKIQKGKNCGPRKALYILARSMGYKHTFLQDDAATKALHNTIKGLNLNFSSKGTLSNYLAIEKGQGYSFRHNDQTDWLIIDVPGLTGELKQARFDNALTMKMRGGHHAYFFNPDSNKMVSVKSKAVTTFIRGKVKEAMKGNWHGFDVVKLIYHTPIDNVDHFMQSILPQAEISTYYGEAVIATSNEEKKEGRLTLRIKNLKAPRINIQYVSQNKQNAYIVSFNTNCVDFMEKIIIIHSFASKLIKENAHLNRQMHKFVQVEKELDFDKTILPFTICVIPFSFSDYYFSKFRNVNNLFFSFPKEIGDPGVISDRVILTKRDKGQLSSLEYLLEHNKKYMQSWSIRLFRTCIENTRMISAERLRQFLGEVLDPSICELIDQLEGVYEQRRKEVDYYAEKEREQQARMIRRFGYIISFFLAFFAILQGILAIQGFIGLVIEVLRLLGVAP